MTCLRMLSLVPLVSLDWKPILHEKAHLNFTQTSGSHSRTLFSSLRLKRQNNVKIQVFNLKIRPWQDANSSVPPQISMRVGFNLSFLTPIDIHKLPKSTLIHLYLGTFLNSVPPENHTPLKNYERRHHPQANIHEGKALGLEGPFLHGYQPKDENCFMVIYGVAGLHDYIGL